MAQLNTGALQWPNDATLSLIQYRRLYQRFFCTTAIHDQKVIWTQISQNINNDH